VTRLLAGLLVLSAPLPALSADLLSVEVDKVDGAYVMRSEVLFEVGIEAIFETMLDWDLSTEFSSVVVESRNLPLDDRGRPGYYTRNEACVAFYCRSFERYGVVEHERYRYIKATVIPEKSDFYYSDERWTFEETDDGTIVTYDLLFEPKFFVPPLIGPYMLKRKMKSGAGDAIDRIEAIARREFVDAR